MSGHSKWSQIKRGKAKLDGQKGATFTKFAREIFVAAKIGGVDVVGNFRLKTAIDKAKFYSMPSDSIKRALQRAAGEGVSDNFEEIQYEGYGPGGVAVIASSMTDNRNRTAGDIRSYFIKCEGNLGETGCVGWMFTQKGVMTVDSYKNGSISLDDLFMSAADLGADDVVDLGEGIFQVTTEPESNTLEKVQQGLQSLGYSANDIEITMIPDNYVTITDENIAKKTIKLIDLLENNDDVQNVYYNFELSEDLEHLF